MEIGQNFTDLISKYVKKCAISIFFIAITMLSITGCSNIPFNSDGEVRVNKDLSVGMEELGVGKIRNKF